MKINLNNLQENNVKKKPQQPPHEHKNHDGEKSWREELIKKESLKLQRDPDKEIAYGNTEWRF